MFSLFCTLASLSDNYRGYLILFAFITFVMHFYWLYVYDKLDREYEDIKKSLSELTSINEALFHMGKEILAICEASASDMQSIKEYFLNEKMIEPAWSIKEGADICCKSIYGVLTKLNSTGNFHVSFDIARDINGKKCIELIGFYNKKYSNPRIYNKTREISSRGYYDERIFHDGNPDYTILTNKEAVKKAFKLKGGNCKYEQYLAIPVMDKNNNMLGLLQITTLQNTRLGPTEDDIKEIAIDYIRPFVSVFLLLCQMDQLCNVRREIKR